MKKFLILFLLAVVGLTACAQNGNPSIGTTTTISTTKKPEAVYVNITAQEAKEIMDTQTGYVILDTRTQAEYDEGHIPGAIVISHDEILQKGAEAVEKGEPCTLGFRGHKEE